MQKYNNYSNPPNNSPPRCSAFRPSAVTIIGPRGRSMPPLFYCCNILFIRLSGITSSPQNNSSKSYPKKDMYFSIRLHADTTVHIKTNRFVMCDSIPEILNLV